MASYRCSGCGRTDFFTSHGFAKHQRKCARKTRGPRVTTGWDDSRPTMGSGNHREPTAMIRVPAWEKVGGTEYDASKLRPSGVIADRHWVVYAYPSDYNSRNNVKGTSYYFSGSGRLTGRDLLKHANAVIAHANKQGAVRFFEFFKVSEQSDGRTLVVMLFGS